MIFKEKSQGLELDISKCGQKQQDSLLSGVAVVASVEWSWGQEEMRRMNTVTLGPIHVILHNMTPNPGLSFSFCHNS